MFVSIISTGEELISGDTVDTNSAFLAARLVEQGFVVREMLNIGDDPAQLAAELHRTVGHSVAVLVTGGLGPTADDRTRHAIAEAAGRELVLDEDSLAAIRRVLRHRLPLGETHTEQAKFPDGAEIFANPSGTARGFAVPVDDALVVAMPGVPGEMKGMFTQSVLPFLVEKFPPRQKVALLTVNLFGVPESQVEAKIGHLLQEGRNPQAGTTVREGVVRVNLRALAPTSEEAEGLIREDVSIINEHFGDAVFGYGELTLAGVLSELLERHNLTIAVAESCTGGLVGDMLTDIPGISRFLLADLVAYSNEVKVKELGVPADMIAQFGAVSGEVAGAMARGVCEMSGAQVGLSTTGIAGPGGATPEKPVGLVYVGLCVDGETSVEKLNLRGDRRRIKDRASKHTLDFARLALLHRARG